MDLSVLLMVASLTAAHPAHAERADFVDAAAVCQTVDQDGKTDGQKAQQPSADEQNADKDKQKPPQPVHTGWATLLKDTGRDFAALPKRKSTWVFVAVGAAGALAAHQGDQYVETHIVGNHRANDFFSLGKWIGSDYLQGGLAVGLWAAGRYIVPPASDAAKTNKLSHLGFDLLRAQILTQAIVLGMKQSIRRNRPTGECCAFPSGHAAATFATAAILERHLGYRGSWPALVIATYVATSRLVDKRHFLSDVVFGAAIGEAAGWTVVGRHGRNEYAVRPVPVPGGVMIAFTRTPSAVAR